MVADNDKEGEEYTPEVTGVEHSEEISEGDYAPLNDFQPDLGTVAPQGSSPLKKLGTAIVLIIAVIAVSSYLMHQKKVRLAAQSEAAGATTSIPKVDVEKPTAPAAKESMSSTKPNASQSESAKAPVASSTVTDLTKKLAVTGSNLGKSAVGGAAVVVDQIQGKTKEIVKSADISLNGSSAKPAEVNSPATAKQLEESAAKMVAPEAVTSPAPTASNVANSPAPASNPEPAVSNITPVVASADSTNVSSQITALKDQGKMNESKINDLTTRVVHLDSAITSLSNSVSSLDKKLSEGKLNVQPTVNNPSVLKPARVIHSVYFERPQNKHKVHAGQHMMMRKAEVSANKAMASLSNNKASYVIRAVVPGRAWLESPNGYKFSVTVGDRVLGFGVVSQINSEYGEVSFDGGDVIKYGPDDH
jgi:hypothetical protein